MNFNGSSQPERLSTIVELGYEHEIVSGEDGDWIEYMVDEKGERVPRRYTVPVRLTAAQVIERTKSVDPGTVAELARGELDALVGVLDAMVGGGILESVGTDPTVSTEAFVRFLSWLVEELQLVEILGGDPGN
jgi:hypothetical protein